HTFLRTRLKPDDSLARAQALATYDLPGSSTPRTLMPGECQFSARGATSMLRVPECESVVVMLKLTGPMGCHCRGPVPNFGASSKLKLGIRLPGTSTGSG